MANILNKNRAEQQELQTRESPISLIDRFFEDMSRDPFTMLTPSLLGNHRLGTGMAFPKVDVSETDSEIRVVANVPGIDPEKIDIEVGDDYLSLSGTVEKQHRDENPKSKVYRIEREYGEFRREFALPARVQKEGIVAKAKNGVLSITLPKTKDERKAKVRIDVE